MTTRYVHAKNGKSRGNFDSSNSPARSVGDALKKAKAGDSIEILDDATYEEDEIIIDKPLTIVSSYVLANSSLDASDAKFDASKLPKLTIKPQNQHRVLRITGTAATRASAGPVRIKGLRITGGTAVQKSSDPALGAGGGIAIIDIDNVIIEQCVITGNKTQVAQTMGWPEPDRWAFRTAVLDLLGSIITTGEEKFINSWIDTANIAIDTLNKVRSKPILPIPHFSRSAVLFDVGKAFDANVSPGRPNHWLGGQAFGGGIAAVWASPTIRRCLVRDNIAQGRGAGIAVIGYGWPVLDECWIDNNRSGAVGRRDGGGVGCEIALPGKLTRDLSEIDVIKFLTSRLSRVKGSHITLSDILDYVKWLANPMTPSPPFRGFKALILDLIYKRSRENTLGHLLYYFATSALSLSKWEAWNQSEILQAQKTSVTIAGCKFTNNWCADDGGGLYASVLSRVRLTKTKIVANISDSMGGGVRLTMGSSGEFTDCELVGNTAIVSDPPAKVKPRNEEDLVKNSAPAPASLAEIIAGGGGLSARNVDLTLTNTLVGSHISRIGKDSNVCSDHAGGGIAFQADTEGMLAGIPDLWTSILVEVFGIREVKILIKSDSRIKNNGAGFDLKRAPLSKTSKSKGGGIWLLQGTFPDAPHVDLRIEAISSTVRDNIAQTKAYTSKVEPGMVIASANEVCIQDLIGNREWTESNFGRLLSGGELRFTP